MSNHVQNTSEQAFDNSFWSILKEAFKGSTRDFTRGSIGLAIFLLAVPMILEMLMESVFALVDIYFVGHLGAGSVAVVVLTESVMALVYAVAMALAVSATATVARRVGENDAEGAAKSAAHAIFLGIGVSLIISLIGLFFAPQILSALGADAAVIEQGTTFMRIMMGGNAVIIFLFLLNAIFRGAGDAAIAMRVLIIANLLNIVLAPCFIYGADIFAMLGINAPVWLKNFWIFPHLGVTGAAVGTNIGRGTGVLFAAWRLFRPSGRITIQQTNWHFNREIFVSLLKIAAPAVLQFLIATASWTALVRVMAKFGDDALAGYGIGLRVIIFALLPAVGLSNAASTLVGQNLGAGNPERAAQSVWRASLINAGFLGAISLIFLVFAMPIVSFFTAEPNVAEYASKALRIVAYGFVFYGFGIVLESAFNGAGDTWTPTYLNLVIFWIVEIPLAYLLAYHFGMGPNGVFRAITFSFSLLAVCAAILFKMGGWKAKKV